MLTKEDIKAALPNHLKTAASDEIADKLNQYSADPEFAKMLRDNFVSYTQVLHEGRFKVEDYVSAVTYVSLKLMGFKNHEAWARTFPDRHQALVARGADSKEISAYVAGYNKGKLVNLIMEQTLVPTWVLNQDIYQKAINVQAELMMGANSEKVRAEAANSILTHLKRPEKAQVELNLGVTENAGMTELRETLAQMAQQQKELIAGGVNTQAIAHQKIQSKEVVEAEYEDVGKEED